MDDDPPRTGPTPEEATDGRMCADRHWLSPESVPRGRQRWLGDPKEKGGRAPSQGPPFGARAPVSLRDEPQTTLRANTMPSECQVTPSKAHSVARARGHVTRSQHWIG